MLTPDRCRPPQAKGWVAKLKLFELAKRQAELASELEGLDPSSLNDILPPDGPPHSALPSPPYTESEPSVIDPRESAAFAVLRQVADQHLRDSARRGILTIQALSRRMLIKLAKQKAAAQRDAAVRKIQSATRRYMTDIVRNPSVTKTSIRRASLRLSMDLKDLTDQRSDEGSITPFADPQGLNSTCCTKELNCQIEALHDALKTKSEEMARLKEEGQLLEERLAKAKSIDSKRLKEVGFSCWEARAAGRPCWEMKLAKYSCEEARDAGYSCKQVFEAGYSCAQAKVAGYSCAEVRSAGSSCTEVYAAGYPCLEAKAAGWSSLPELKAAGYVTGLLAAGYTLEDAERAGYTLEEIKRAGYTCKDAKRAGYTLEKIKRAGYTCAEAKEAGSLPFDCREAGYTFEEAKQCGYRSDTSGPAWPCYQMYLGNSGAMSASHNKWYHYHDI